MQANLDNPDFNPLLTPAEAASDPSTWGENKPNRLRVWQEHRYAYDTWGNCIEKKSGPNQVRHFEWDAEHRLRRATIRKSNGRFVHVEHWGYDYDPFGRRIAKYRLDPAKPERCRPWLDGGTTHFSWDGNRLLLERQGERQSLYVYEPDSFVPLALVRSEGDEEVAEQDFPMPAEWLALKERHPADWDATAGALIHKIEAKRQARRERQGHVGAVQEESAQGLAEILHFHTDHLGTPRELTNASGHIVWSATYKAWGNTAKIEHPGRFVHQVVGNTQVERWQEQSDPVEQNLRFQGQYFDLETGLHYNRFRYYDPDIGRFVSQDPIGLAGGINNYQYAPNPVGWIDPLGLNKDLNCHCSLTFEKNPKHGSEQRGRANPEPTNPQKTLENSIELPGNTTRRIGVDKENGEFAIFDEHRPGKFHGNTRTWQELDQKMQAVLRKVWSIKKVRYYDAISIVTGKY